MDSVVQLLKNLQFWNPDQREVGVGFVAFYVPWETSRTELAKSKSATLSNGKENISASIIFAEYNLQKFF